MSKDKKDIKDIKIEQKVSSFFQRIFKKKVPSNLELLETDLIKDEIEIKFEWRKDLLAFFTLLLAAFVFISEAYIFLSLWENKKELKYSYYLEENIKKIEEEIEEIKTEHDVVLDFKNKLNLSKNILNKHIYWSNFFNFLETNTLKDNIYYKSFSGNVKEGYVLPTVTNNVLAVGYQSAVFLADPFTMSASRSNERIVDSTNPSNTIIEFDFNLKVDEKIFN